MTVERLKKAIEETKSIQFHAEDAVGCYETISREEALRRTEGLTVDDLHIFITSDLLGRGPGTDILFLGLHDEKSRRRQDIDDAVAEAIQNVQEFMIDYVTDMAKELAGKISVSKDEAYDEIISRIKLTTQ